MASDLRKMFLKTATVLFEARQGVADLFFSRRLDDTIDQLFESYLRACLDDTQLRRHAEILKNTSVLVEEVAYLRQGDSVTLAVAQETILNYLRETLRSARAASMSQKKIESAPVQSPAMAVAKSASQDKTVVRPKEINSGLSRQKILEFVRKAPERRTKDIIDEFSALSERTVKRGLKELSEEGLIVKKSENRAVYYSAV